MAQYLDTRGFYPLTPEPLDNAPRVTYIARRDEATYYRNTKQIRKRGKTIMCPSASQLIANKAVDSGAILHGSDVPKSKYSGFKVKIRAVREPGEGFNAIAIADIDPIFESAVPDKDGKKRACECIALNKTNMKALANQLGDNTDKWAGKTVTFIVIFTRNPKTGKNVPSLGVAE